MIMKYSFSLIYLLSFLITLAQSDDKLVDSLYQELKKNPSDSMEVLIMRAIVGSESDLSKANFYLEKLENRAHVTGDYQLLVFVLINRGLREGNQGNFLKSIDYYYQGANLADSMNYKKGVIEARINLGQVYKKIENFPESIKNYKLALKLLEDTKNELYTAVTHTNIGFTFYRAGIFDSAEYYTNIPIDYYKESNSLFYNYAVGNLYLINVAQQKPGSEEKLLDLIEDLDSIGDDFGIADYYVEMSKIFYHQANIDKAIKYGEEGYEIAKQNGFKSQIVVASKVLSQVYEDLALFEKAFSYQKELIIYKDSIINVEEMQRMANVRTEYEVSQKQAEVDLLAAEKRNQQIITAAVALFLILSLIAIYFIYKNYRDKNKLAVQLSSQKQELEKLNRTKDKFFSIISHDIRGPVHAFNGISRMIKLLVNSKNTDQLIPLAEEIENSVTKLSNLLDNLLSWAVQQQDGIPYNPEEIVIKNSLENLAATLKNSAESKNISINVESSEDHVAFVDQNTTETIFRNLVSNALKFTQEGGQIHVKSETGDQNLRVIISDSGVGIDPEKMHSLFDFSADKSSYGTSGEKGLGLGLQLVKEFVELNKGSITVESEKGKGTRFIVSLPGDKNTAEKQQDALT